MNSNIGVLFISVYCAFSFFLSCSNVGKEGDKSSESRNESIRDIIIYKIQKLNENRAGFMCDRQPWDKSAFRSRMDSIWCDLYSHRDSVLKCLLTFRLDTGRVLYGAEFKSYPHQKGYLPDNVHALYLMEGLISGNYFFNRNIMNSMGLRTTIGTEDLNFVYDTILHPSLPILPSYYWYIDSMKIRTSYECRSIGALFDVYEKAILSQSIDRSPLEGTKYKWLTLKSVHYELLDLKTYTYPLVCPVLPSCPAPPTQNP